MAVSKLSRVVRKPDFCLCENKAADQLRSNCEADQRLCFRYTNSTSPLLSKSKKFKPLTIFCDCTGRFVSHSVGNPEDRFSHVEAQMNKYKHIAERQIIIIIIIIIIIMFSSDLPNSVCITTQINAG